MDSAIALAKQFEGLRLKAYLCPAGIPSIGYGATGADVYLGLEVTQEWAEDRLLKHMLLAVKQAVRLSPELFGNKLDAVADFIFNLGATRYAASTLRRVINTKQYNRVPDQFRRWVHASGRVLPGLILRREAEISLFSH